MEIYDYLFQILMANVDNVRTEEMMNIHWSLIQAAEKGQWMHLRTKHGDYCGFVTWEIRNNKDKAGMIDIGLANLVIIKTARGTYNLMRVINILRKKYPKVATFVWENRKTKEPKVFQQRGIYADMETFIQSKG